MNKFPGMDLHIVAHSLGGTLALLFSEELFSRAKSFADLEGNLVPEDCAGFSKKLAAVKESDRPAHLKNLAAQFAGDKMLRFDKTTPDAFYRSAISLVEWTESGKLLDLFNNIKVRKAFFFGEENKDISTLKKIKSEEKIMVPKVGHPMMTDNPKDFYIRLAQFIYKTKPDSK